MDEYGNMEDYDSDSRRVINQDLHYMNVHYEIPLNDIIRELYLIIKRLA